VEVNGTGVFIRMMRMEWGGVGGASPYNTPVFIY